MPSEVVLLALVSIAAFLYFIKMVFDFERRKLPHQGTKDEIAALRKRVAVLERIVTDQGHSLAAEIAALEDRSEDPDTQFATPRERARHTL